jgi:hypothetical protein
MVVGTGVGEPPQPATAANIRMKVLMEINGFILFTFLSYSVFELLAGLRH